jgi:N-methylhydantoinase B
MPACPGGSEFAIAASGFDTAGQRFLHLEFHNTTGNGGGPDRDGQDAGPYCIGNLANVPVELIEAENPIRMEAYAFLPDTGGAGQYRGAMGIVRQYRFLAEETAVQVRSDRFKSRPWGLFGGGEGAAARAFLNPGTPGEEALPSKFVRKFKAGDVFRAEMAGSGGYGDPLSREPAAVLEDVRLGKVSRERALEDYGVVVKAGVLEVDADATRRRRGASK